MRIDYVGINLTQPEKVRYRYKLDGEDGGWRDARERRSAFYTNLDPGPHRFQVVASNGDGAWPEEGATLDFDIPPAFVQTGWFIAVCATTAAAALWLLIRFRFRQLALRMRGRIEERVAERERIARELHDTLLQSIQGLIFQVHAASRQLASRIPSGDPAIEILAKALQHADQVIAEGRDRVLDLRTPDADLDDLPLALTTLGEELSALHGTAFRSITEGTPRALNADVKDEAYQIGREALLNAFRHAQANSIEVQFIYGGGDLRIRIRDDGVGLDSTIGESGRRPGHWGLTGMSERAERIGAKIDMWSRAMAGTEIELVMDASIAYQRHSRQKRWRVLLQRIQQIFGLTAPG